MTKNQEIAILKQTTEQLKSSVKNWQAQWDNQYKFRCEESARFRKELEDQRLAHTNELKRVANEVKSLYEKGLDAVQEAKIKAERDTIGEAYKYLVDSLTANKQG